MKKAPSVCKQIGKPGRYLRLMPRLPPRRFPGPLVELARWVYADQRCMDIVGTDLKLDYWKEIFALKSPPSATDPLSAMPDERFIWVVCSSFLGRGG